MLIFKVVIVAFQSFTHKSLGEQITSDLSSLAAVESRHTSTHVFDPNSASNASQFLKLFEYNAIVEGGEGANWYWATDQNADPKIWKCYWLKWSDGQENEEDIAKDNFIENSQK